MPRKKSLRKSDHAHITCSAGLGSLKRLVHSSKVLKPISPELKQNWEAKLLTPPTTPNSVVNCHGFESNSMGQ